MDREDAVRIVVFEYLLPMQRRARLRCIRDCMQRERMSDFAAGPEPTLGGLLERLLLLSDCLLKTQGFPTSFVMPLSMMHSNPECDARRNVSVLIDSPGPYRWFDTSRTRCSDPDWGLRTFRSGTHMPAGRILVG